MKYWCKKSVAPTPHEWEGPIYGRDEDRRSEGFCTNTSRLQKSLKHRSKGVVIGFGDGNGLDAFAVKLGKGVAGGVLAHKGDVLGIHKERPVAAYKAVFGEEVFQGGH